MKKFSILLLFSIILLACGKKTETVYRDVPVLSASSIYRGDSIYSYLNRYKDSNKELAEAYLKKSKEAEANDLTKAIYCCKRAITLYPNAAYYKILAPLIERSGNFSELYELYYQLISTSWVNDTPGNSQTGREEYVLGKPDEDTYLEYLVAAMRAHNALYSDDVYLAHDCNIDLSKLKERFFSDPRLKLDMTTTDSKEMMLLFLTEDELASYSKLETTFRDMLASVKDVSPVFQIDKDKVHEFDYHTYSEEADEMEGPSLSYVFINYLEEKREHPDEWYTYNYEHVMNIGDSIKAVIYAVDSSETACPVEMRHIYHRLVTYDPSARIICSKIVAMQSGDQLMTMDYRINKFTVTGYRRNWKKPYDKHDFDNYITGTDKVTESSFEILPDGTIKEAATVAVQ